MRLPNSMMPWKPIALVVVSESAVHFAGDKGPLLIDKPYGEGHVTLLTEPYIIQNNGIGQGDNADHNGDRPAEGKNERVHRT